MSPDAVVQAVPRWSEEFVETPHPIFGDLPVCPFARAARLRNSIRFEVREFAADETADRAETLFVVAPEMLRAVGMPR